MRLRVIDPGMVVDVLGSGAEEEAVEGALRALRGEGDADVGAREAAPQSQVVGGEVAVALLPDRQRVDVRRRRALLLQLGVLEQRAFPDANLGDGVREVSAAAGVGLDDRGLGTLSGRDQNPRVRDLGPVGRRRVEKDVGGTQ